MAEEVINLHDHLKLIIEYINTKKSIKLDSEPHYFTQKISNFEKKFNKFSMKTTSDYDLSTLYKCVGRLKFYADKKLFVYLEVEETDDSHDNVSAGSAFMWPVSFTWKIEIVGKARQASTLGSASYVFNRPRQGFVAHPNDWIVIELDKIVATKLISSDGSATLRWTVVSKPVFQIEDIDVFKKKLDELLQYFANFKEPEEQVTHILKTLYENGKKMSLMEGKLQQLETMLKDFKEQFELENGRTPKRRKAKN